ncbi:5508_t:CDS:2, partial [Acaulospora morrowiae]
ADPETPGALQGRIMTFWPKVIYILSQRDRHYVFTGPMSITTGPMLITGREKCRFLYRADDQGIYILSQRSSTYFSENFGIATHGKIVSIIFDQTINVTFNDDEVRAIKIDAPGAVLMKENVFFRLSRELTFSNKDNPIYIDDDTTSTEDELVDDIHIKDINQPQVEEIVPLIGVDRDNQSQEEETVPSTGVDQDNQLRENEIVPSTGVDQSNQSGEKETVPSIQSQDDETSSSAISKGKVAKDVQFNINKRKLKNRQNEDEGNVEDWFDCEKCYGLQNQFCKFCGCFRCERKNDPAHILLCDGNCGNGYHTYCLKPSIDEIPSGNWYCDECRSLDMKQVESESSGSKGKEVVLTSDEIQIPLERNDSLGVESTYVWNLLMMDYEQKNGIPPISKILRGLVAEKMMTILCIDGRQERRYWTGMWRLIKLLHITRCQ